MPASVTVELQTAFMPDSKTSSLSLTDQLQDSLTVDGLLRHSRKLQAIANENGGTRVFSSSGHNATLHYIAESVLQDGYHTWLEPMYLNYTEKVKQEVTLVSPFEQEIPVGLMTFTESTPLDGVTAELALVPGFGCEASDYPDVNHKIVLLSRGSCAFGQKAYAAGQAGASALLIHNNEKGSLSGTLGQDFPPGAPTGGISDEDGAKLIQLLEQGIVELQVAIVEKREERLTYNVIAETKGGDKSNLIVIGGHSDSVVAGPGINDNGSGTAALLELSHLFRDVEPVNAVRFCWWTAEEYGLLGAKHHVDNLSEKERHYIALYLNFDMIGSPNAVNGIYDGDGSDSKLAGPPGSAAIEKLFQDFFADKKEPYDPSEFDGRSDYGPFIQVGIPSGGLFTGAEVPMTEDQAKRYGRKAGLAYDQCYHQACDTIDNLNHDAFLLNARGVAHALATFSQSTALVDKQREKFRTSLKEEEQQSKIDIESIWPSGAEKHAHSI
ncbi:M28 family peptidase [Zychaea mexicana]|uniref:M28 family peptidase n=1 Tax=Zychaea mexicana TaxID=64656 RepID=UPI0022FDC8E0|nr:M28 family peptidase [Zychaea mexicana]KAI9490827.1 M28 family peptidase [Zychaea mexicana]